MVTKMNTKIKEKTYINKDFNDEQNELINRIYKKVLMISKMKMDSISYQLYLTKEKEIYFLKDTLIHFTKYDDELIKNISKNGLLASSFLESNNLDPIISFSKITEDKPLKELKDNNLNKKNTIGFIVNPTSKLGGILYYNILDLKFDNNSMVRDILPKNKRVKDESLSYLLVGIPANSVSGILVEDTLIQNKSIIDNLKLLFPNSYIITNNGNIIKDRSNIIKIEDYEEISYNNAKVVVENSILKKEIKVILNAIKENTSYYQQAKIFKKLGYKIPKQLLSKLSKEEIDNL